MGIQPDREHAARRRRLFIAAMAVLVGVAIVVPLAGTLLQSVFGADDADTAVPATRAAHSPPPVTIAPLQVRPVVGVEGSRPDRCPPPAPVPPTAEMRACDIAKTGLYALGPEGVTLHLIRVDSLLSPITNSHIVQVSLTPEASQAFERFTAANVGKQIAFVRAGVVVSAPKISEPIAGSTLQLSGELTAEQSAEMARLLRDET